MLLHRCLDFILRYLFNYPSQFHFHLIIIKFQWYPTNSCQWIRTKRFVLPFLFGRFITEIVLKLRQNCVHHIEGCVVFTWHIVFILLFTSFILFFILLFILFFPFQTFFFLFLFPTILFPAASILSCLAALAFELLPFSDWF